MARNYPLSTRARVEAYAGLLLLLVGLTVLTFGGCPTPIAQNHRSKLQPLRTGDAALPSSVVYGNAAEDGLRTKGWWVGHFMGSETGRRTEGVETKWAVHEAGEKHGEWTSNRVASSMAVLVEGKHRMEFEGSHVLLENVGDYVIWGNGVNHSWTALERSTLLCVRWPSVGGDQGNGRMGVGVRSGEGGRMLNTNSSVKN